MTDDIKGLVEPLLDDIKGVLEYDDAGGHLPLQPERALDLLRQAAAALTQQAEEIERLKEDRQKLFSAGVRRDDTITRQAARIAEARELLAEVEREEFREVDRMQRDPLWVKIKAWLTAEENPNA